MNHCSWDCEACSCSCMDGSATLRMVLSITTTIRQMHRTPRIHQRRDWTSSSLVPSLVSGARVSTLTLVAVPVTCVPKRRAAHWRGPWTRLSGREAGGLLMTEAEGLSPYGSPRAGETVRRIRIHHLQAMKDRGERWAMLTAYEQYAAAVFDEVGIPVLLVGDSAANNVYGYDTTLPVTVDELLPLVRAVARSTRRALVVGDLPFGSYQESPGQALQTAVRFMKEGGAQAVKLEGGRVVTQQVETIVGAGIPVMAHIGFTPQSEHGLGGYRVQGRGEAADKLLDDALALERAGAFAVVLEMVPSTVAGQVTKELRIPTIGIGAGADCDAQVMVWQDMAGLNSGPAPRFVKRFADLRSVLADAAKSYADEGTAGTYPAPEHSYE